LALDSAKSNIIGIIFITNVVLFPLSDKLSYLSSFTLIGRTSPINKNLAGKKHLKNIGVVAMIKGEFKYKIIDAQKLLKQSKDNIIRVPLQFDKTPEIGPVRVGDYFFACVSANVLKPVEGNECEHREASHIGKIFNLIARHD